MARYSDISRFKSDGDHFPGRETDTRDDIPLKKLVPTTDNAPIYNDGSEHSAPIYNHGSEASDEYEHTAFLMDNSDLPKVDITPFDQGEDEVDGVNNRTGTFWTATAHVITGVIGAGVLSLAWSTAQLGWVAGPLAMIVFAMITLLCTLLLSECYISHDPESGPIRHRSLIGAVKYNLGNKRQGICAFFVAANLIGAAVAYTITVTDSISAIQKSNCYHRNGHDAHCGHNNSKYMLIFGALQIFVSQIPDFHNMAWLSIIAAAMSFTYAFIGLALGLAKTIENGKIMGSFTGISAPTYTDKIWLVFQGLSDIAFAYPYTVILLEIQDTLKSPPPESQTMIKASRFSIFTTTIFYLCCGCFGYAAFGDKTPGNLLTGFGFYEPYWLVDLANACIILHLVGGYQIFSQVIFALVEKWFAAKYPEHALSKNLDLQNVPLLGSFELNVFRLGFRTLYVAIVTGIAMAFPYFNQVLGVLGALNFWPLGIYFPVEVFIAHRKIRPWTKQWLLLESFSSICLLVSVVGLVGSIHGLVRARLGHTRSH